MEEEKQTCGSSSSISVSVVAAAAAAALYTVYTHWHVDSVGEQLQKDDSSVSVILWQPGAVALKHGVTEERQSATLTRMAGVTCTMALLMACTQSTFSLS
jgi:hypothetical protein